MGWANKLIFKRYASDLALSFDQMGPVGFFGVVGNWLSTQATQVFNDATELMVANEPLSRVVRLDMADFDFTLTGAGFDLAARVAVCGIVPMAMMVRQAQLRVARDYINYKLTLGQPAAAVFTSLDEAQRWAGRQAAVREHWNRLPRRPQAAAAPSSTTTAGA